MSSVIQMLFGTNWKTTVVGYLLAILTAIKPLLESGATTADIINAVITALMTAIFGRLAADSKKLQEIEQKVANK